MKLVDVNVLLYAVNQDAPQHERVRKWWESAIRDEEQIGLAWMVILGFLRLSTHSNVFERPLTPQQATAKMETWLARPSVRIIAETEEHWQFLKRLLDETGTTGNLTNDAHLATIAIAYGASIASCDTDFNRFRQVRWENPMA